VAGTKNIHQGEGGQKVLQRPADLGFVVDGRVQGILDAIEIAH
jgi:hypothetical protein